MLPSTGLIGQSSLQLAATALTAGNSRRKGKNKAIRAVFFFAKTQAEGVQHLLIAVILRQLKQSVLKARPSLQMCC